MITFKTETEGFETFRVCDIEENEALDTVGIGMIRNNQIKGIANLSYSRLNDKRALRYNVSSKISLQQFFMGKVDKKRFLTVLRNIVAAVDILSDYMMDKDQLITDKKEIYVNVGTLEVEMLYCPLLKEKKELDLTTLVKNLITDTEFDKNDGEYVAELINFLNKPGGFTPAELKEYIDTLLGKPAPARTPEPAPVENNAFANQAVSNNAGFNSQNTYGGFAANNQGGFGAQPAQPAAMPQASAMGQPVQAPQYGQPFAIPGAPAGTPVMPAPAEKKSLFSFFGSKKNKDNAESEAKPKKAAKASKKNKDFVTPEGIIIPGVQEKGGNLPDPPKPAGASIRQNVPTYGNMNMQQPQVAPQTNMGAMNQPQYGGQQTYMSQPVMPKAEPQQAPFAQAPTYAAKPVAPQNYNNVSAVNSTAINTVVTNVSETTVLGAQGQSHAGETTILSEGYNTIEKKRRPYLIRKRTNQKIDISKDVFRIGKEQSYVDLFISDNSAISRSHADIVKRGDEYFIIDNNSLNHTYINGEQIESQVPMPLKDFDTVTLADEFFEYRL